MVSGKEAGEDSGEVDGTQHYEASNNAKYAYFKYRHFKLDCYRARTCVFD